MLNNPLKYTDPDGEWVVQAISTLVFAYLGGAQTNNFQMNPVKWDWNSAGTWYGMANGAFQGYMIGDALENALAKNRSSLQSDEMIINNDENLNYYEVPFDEEPVFLASNDNLSYSFDMMNPSVVQKPLRISQYNGKMSHQIVRWMRYLQQTKDTESLLYEDLLSEKLFEYKLYEDRVGFVKAIQGSDQLMGGSVHYSILNPKNLYTEMGIIKSIDRRGGINQFNITQYSRYGNVNWGSSPIHIITDNNNYDLIYGYIYFK